MTRRPARRPAKHSCNRRDEARRAIGRFRSLAVAPHEDWQQCSERAIEQPHALSVKSHSKQSREKVVVAGRPNPMGRDAKRVREKCGGDTEVPLRVTVGLRIVPDGPHAVSSHEHDCGGERDQAPPIVVNVSRMFDAALIWFELQRVKPSDAGVS
jgi:hypothetical protein